jgi:NAD(P)-dependent dehydrogenase (short-subunit alcohol dehydrogenase family)
MRVEHCVPGLVAYSTAKMAQVGLMIGLAAELQDTGIRINAIVPVAATRVLRRTAPELTSSVLHVWNSCRMCSSQSCANLFLAGDSSLITFPRCPFRSVDRGDRATAPAS